MIKILRGTRVLSLASVALLSAGMALSLPSAASASISLTGLTNDSSSPDYGVTIDCATLAAWDEGIHILPVVGGSVTVTTVNCGSVVMDVSQSDPGYPTEVQGYTAGGVHHTGDATGVTVPSSFTIDSNTKVNFINTNSDEFLVNVDVLIPQLADPAGELKDTVTINIPGTDPLATEWPDDVLPVDPDDQCGMDNGQHVYGTYDFDVTAGGEHTFRFVQSTPADGEVYWWGSDPFLNLPFIAVYSEFDPTDPMANLVACDQQRDGEEFASTNTGYVTTFQYSEAVGNLPAGHYTLVLTTYERSEPGSDWFDPESGIIEIWGPVTADPSQPDLPNTGVNSDFAPLGVALLGLGGIALAAVVLLKRRSA